MIKIKINGSDKEFSSSSNLKSIIEEFCKNSSRVIAEVNGTIVKNPNWEQTLIKDGDVVELVSFVGGG